MEHKILAISNIPTPYRIPLLNLVSKKLAEHNHKLHILFAMPSYNHRKWINVLDEAKFDYSILDLPKIQIGPENTFCLPFGLLKKIAMLSPSLIVAAGFDFTTMICVKYAIRNNIPYIIWSGETKRRFSYRNGLFFRNYLRKKIIQKASSFVAYGSAAKEYLQSIGADKEKIYIAINCVDTDFFKKKVYEFKQKKHKIMKNNVKILFVGYLQKRKGLEFVIKALTKINSDQIILDIVGDGPENKYCKELASSLGLKNVYFHGFKQKAELPKFYSNADIFVFPSTREIFGLVLVEAAASGLPIIASKFAGGTVDVVKPAKNGYIVDPKNVKELVSRTKELCEDRKKREKMGKYSLKIINETVNIHKSAEEFVNAIMSCIKICLASLGKGFEVSRSQGCKGISFLKKLSNSDT